MPTVAIALRSCLAGLALIVAVPAGAQEWGEPWADPLDRPPRLDITASTGALLPTSWSDSVLLGTISPAFGILEQVLVRDLRVEPSTTFGASVIYWRGRYGFRTDAGFAESSVTIGGPVIDGEPGLAQSVDVRTWLYGVRGAVGLIEYTPRRWVWPYVFGGAGGVTYDLQQNIGPPLLTFVERGGTAGGEGDLVIVADGREFVLAVNELGVETVFAVTLGAGADLRIPFGPAGVGLRFEVSDQIAASPVRVRIRELGQPTSDTRIRFGPVHHLRASAGLVVRIGR